MIVWVASYPRSGNNLFLLTLQHVYGIDHGSEFQERLGLGELLEDRGVSSSADYLRTLRELPEAQFIKTHNLNTSADPSSAVYLVRDGRDALVSYAHFAKAQGAPYFQSATFERRVLTLMKQASPFGTWSENVRSWTRRQAPTVVIRFEDLISDPGASVRRALEEVGVRVPETTGELPSFQELRQRDPHVFRRGIAGSWKSEFPPSLEDLFWELNGAEMEAMGYSRR